MFDRHCRHALMKHVLPKFANPVIVGQCLLGTKGRRVRATAPEDGCAHTEQALDVVAAVVVVVVVSAVQWLKEDHWRMQNIIDKGVIIVAAVVVVLESTGGWWVARVHNDERILLPRSLASTKISPLIQVVTRREAHSAAFALCKCGHNSGRDTLCLRMTVFFSTSSPPFAPRTLSTRW